MPTSEIDHIHEGMGGLGYLTERSVATAVYLGRMLGKALLVEGPPGTGKTELAKCVAQLFNTELVRLQCYEGLDEAKALYEWNYRKQLLFLQSRAGAIDADWRAIESDLFDREFLIERPIMRAMQSPHPVVLLIDEVDRLELETEALLLEALSDYQISVPELGTVKAASVPMIFLTSNATRDLSDALRRRCCHFGATDPHHPALHDRVLDFQQFSYSGPQCHAMLLYSAVPSVSKRFFSPKLRAKEHQIKKVKGCSLGPR